MNPGTTAPTAFAKAVQASALALALLACAGALLVVLPNAWADIHVMKTRWQIGQWQAGKAPQPGIVEWGKARTIVSDALRITPSDPALHEQLAYLYASRAMLSAAAPDVATSFMQQALASYQAAAKLRPMSAATWANVALAHHVLAGQQTADPELWRAFDKALQYGNREPFVQRALADVGLARWAHMPQTTRSAFNAMLLNVQDHNRADVEAIAKRHKRTNLLPPPL